jgi:hypothetical protein
MGILVNLRVLLLGLAATTTLHGQVAAREKVIDAISVGLFLVRVAKGSHATLELTSAWGGVWLPDRLQVFATARLGLRQVLHIEQTIHYSRYSSVPADVRAIHPADGRDTLSAVVSPFKGTTQ